MGNKDKQKKIKEAYIKKHGVWYEDALFRTRLVCKMLAEDKEFDKILDGAGFFPTAHILADNYPPIWF